MPVDQAIIEILDKEAAIFDQTHTRVKAIVSNSYAKGERTCFYDVQLFRESAMLGKHVLRISHESPGASFPVEITFGDPAQPEKDVAGYPEVLADKVRNILASAVVN